MNRVFLGLAVVALSACQTPVFLFSGSTLTGEERTVDSFAFAKAYRLLAMEVRPADPYSVNLRVVMRQDQLYIDAAERRRWHKYLKEDPRVRVKLGDHVYPATAVVVEDSELTSQFLKGRTIYRIVPR